MWKTERVELCVDHCGDFKGIWGKSFSLGYDLSFILWMICIDAALSFVKKKANLLLTYEFEEKRQGKYKAVVCFSPVKSTWIKCQNEDNICLGNHFE